MFKKLTRLYLLKNVIIYVRMNLDAKVFSYVKMEITVGYKMANVNLIQIQIIFTIEVLFLNGSLERLL